MSLIDNPNKWQLDVQHEAIAFANAVSHNFKHGLITSKQMLPIQTTDALMKQLDIFLEAFGGIYVGTICSYVNASSAAEEATIEMIRDKFKAYRMQRLANPDQKPEEISQ